MASIEKLLLFVVKDTVLSDFEVEGSINFKLLLQKVLMPFFQLRTRVIKQGQMFSIGQIQFFVASSTFEDGQAESAVGGRVSQKTTIRLIKSVRTNEPLECVILAPIMHSVPRRDQVLAETLKPYFLTKRGQFCYKN